MKKMQWKKCKGCGAVTDIDEKLCPCRDSNDNPGHKLETVELSLKEVRKLYQEKKIWTKHIFKIEAILFKQKRPA